MARLIWTERALADLEQLLAFIEQDSPIAAKRFAQKLVARVESLQNNPLLGGFVLEDESHTYRETLQGY